MISGLARAAAVFQQPEYLQLATQAAEFILNHQWVRGGYIGSIMREKPPF
jgi:uncharacterized protein YyaL (SSP411 family)